MNEFFSVIRPYLETLYFLASIALVAGVFIGIKQLKLVKEELNLVKEDMNVRFKRASVEKSIEYLNWFATAFIPVANTSFDKVKASGVPEYDGPFNAQFIFDTNCSTANPDVIAKLKSCIENDSVAVLNQLEYFSAALMSGIADEELTFSPAAQTFCEFVEFFYPVICFHRPDESSTMYSNTIKLYNMWNARLKKIDLERKRSKLDEDISNIEVNRIRSIGS